MTTAREDAEFIRMQLLLGLISMAEAIAWCDGIIESQESPDIAIINTSMASSKGVESVAGALAVIEGDFSEASVAKRLLGSMYELVKQDRKRAQVVAHAISQMACQNYAPDTKAVPGMMHFYDAVDLALDGVYGDPEKVIDEMLVFLRDYAAVT